MKDEFREMVTDIHKNEGQEEIDRIVGGRHEWDQVFRRHELE